jgi:hypothetical protein
VASLTVIRWAKPMTVDDPDAGELVLLMDEFEELDMVEDLMALVPYRK